MGRIGNYRHAPLCDKDELAPILQQVVLGKTAKSMREKAAKMAEECRVAKPGCEIAARGIVGMLAGKEAK